MEKNVRVRKVNGIIAVRVHHKAVLCVDKAYAVENEWIITSSGRLEKKNQVPLTFFVPDALICPVLPASPRQALGWLRLPWGKGEIEEMVQ